MSRYVTDLNLRASLNPTPFDEGMEDPERYRLMRLCPCADCNTSGKALDGARCKTCRGEGRSLEEVATCGTPEAVGLAIVTLAREGEWDGDCPFGLIDRHGEKGKKWLILPYRGSARNVSDAARTLARSKNPIPQQ